MLTTFYFKVHQPRRTRVFNTNDPKKFTEFLELANRDPKAAYFSDEENEDAFRKRLELYKRSNVFLLELMKQNKEFKAAFSISGCAMRMAEKYKITEFFDEFKRMMDTGKAEILAQPYYHSLAGLFDDPEKKEFERQINMHLDMTQKYFGVRPVNFVNPEMIYNDKIGQKISELGFRSIITEGLEGDIERNSVAQINKSSAKVLFRNTELSNILIYSDKREIPAQDYAENLASMPGNHLVIGMNYHTLAKQLENSPYLAEMIKASSLRIIERGSGIANPKEAVKSINPSWELSVPEQNTRSWSIEQNANRWLKEEWQKKIFTFLQFNEESIRSHKRKEVNLDIFGNLLTADNFASMADYMDQNSESIENENKRSSLASFDRIASHFIAETYNKKVHARNGKHKKIKVMIISPEMRELPKELGKIAQDFHMGGGGLGEVCSMIFKKGYESEKGTEFEFYAGFPDLRRKSYDKKKTISHALQSSKRQRDASGSP